MLRSAAYACRMVHARLGPRPHRFSYRLPLFALDLDELPELHRRLALFSYDRPNLYALHERDHLPLGDPAAPLKQRVLALLADRGVGAPVERVVLVALPRVLGYQFNPVAFYFCLGPGEAPVAALAEVTNTFGEVKPYLLPHAGGGRFRLRVRKGFYVSPFSEADAEFDFRLSAPGARLRLAVDTWAGGRRTVAAAVAGEARPLTDARLLAWLLAYPAAAPAVTARIHAQAIRLWLKGVPWFPKAAKAEAQIGLVRRAP